MDCELFRDDMMDVLYGEETPVAAHRFRAHEAECAGCREEAAAFRAMRRELQVWDAPAPPRVLARPPARRRFAVPLAAAAALLVGLLGALAAGGSDVTFAGGRFSLRLGRDAELRMLLAEQEMRHRREVAALRADLARTRLPAATVAGPAATVDETALLATVRALIRESERRQSVALGASLRDLEDRSEARRQYDLARVSAGLSYLDGKAGLEAARTSELMGQVLRASQQK